jgi:hypothetical protein
MASRAWKSHAAQGSSLEIRELLIEEVEAQASFMYRDGNIEREISFVAYDVLSIPIRKQYINNLQAYAEIEVTNLRQERF